MNEHPIQTFIDLIKFDQEVIVIEADGKKLEHEIEQLKQQEIETQQSITHMKNRLHDARKEVDAKELEMKDLDLQRQQKKERLETVANEKEYQAVKSEIEKLKQAQNNLDDALLCAWNALEAAQKEHDTVLVSAEKKLEQLQQTITEKTSKIETLKADLKRLNALRPEKEKSVPVEWLEKYAMMRLRVSDPVVPVMDNSCSACFSLIPNQDILELKKKKLLQCKGCYRFLYIADQQPSESKEAS